MGLKVGNTTDGPFSALFRDKAGLGGYIPGKSAVPLGRIGYQDAGDRAGQAPVLDDRTAAHAGDQAAVGLEESRIGYPEGDWGALTGTDGGDQDPEGPDMLSSGDGEDRCRTRMNLRWTIKGQGMRG